MPYQRNDTTTISSALGDTIVGHRRRDGVPPQVPTALDLDTRGAMQLAAVPIAGMREQTFTAGLDESEGAELSDGSRPQRRLGKVWGRRTRPPEGCLTKGMAEARLEAILAGDDPLVNIAPSHVTFRQRVPSGFATSRTRSAASRARFRTTGT